MNDNLKAKFEEILKQVMHNETDSFAAFYKEDVLKAMELAYELALNENKKTLDAVRELANQYISKQDYNEHSLPHVFNEKIFGGATIKIIAEDFLSVLPPVTNKD